MSGDTVVMTGATGFLGSHLMAALVERGNRLIVLGRSRDGVSLKERIAALLQWFGLAQRKGQVETLEADLLAPLCGLSRARYFGLCLNGSQIIHCACDTRFSEVNRLASIDTNVRSLSAVLELARKSRVSYFHHLSTAYCVGTAARHCLERLEPAPLFANVYEETKAWAEREVMATCERFDIPYTILRPSIVYGNSRTGRATRFTALYHHVRSLSLIRDLYRRDIEEQGGGKSRQLGISLEGGVLHMPLRVVLPHRGTINLIPVDYFVRAALLVMENARAGQIYHLTSEEPETLETLAGYCERFLKLKGIKIIYGDMPEPNLQNPPESLFNALIKPYRHYLSDTRTFDRHRTNKATAGLRPPRLSYEIFHTCMAYAASVDWGRYGI